MGANKSFMLSEAIRRGDDRDAKHWIRKKANVTKRMKDKRIPFIECCRYGRLEPLKSILLKDPKKKKIKRNLIERGLVENCGGNTNLEMTKILLEERSAHCDSRDPFDQTALMNCCKRSDKFAQDNEIVMRARRDTAILLIKKGADFSRENLDGVTAIQIACREENHTMAMLLAQKGCPIMPLYRWMMKSKATQKNWVGGSVLKAFAWKNDEFSKLMKKQFMKMFDKDNSGALDESELKKFIALNIKLQFESGMEPTTAFTYHPSIPLDELVGLLEERAPKLMAAYMHFDKNSDGKYTWNELKPIAVDFYGQMWSANMPQEIPNYYGNESMQANDQETTAKHRNNDARLAAAGISTTEPVLPAGWVSAVDPSTGNIYFANPETGESSWDVPV